MAVVPGGWRNRWLQLGLLLAGMSLAVQAWQGVQRQAQAERIARAAAPGELRMISSTSCGICTQARRWFAEQQVPVDECFVERDAACRAQFEQLQAPGTPVILVRGQPQLGFSPARIERALERGPATRSGG